MKKAAFVVALLVLAELIIAQTSSPSQITLKPIAAVAGCVADATGDTLCGASDGFYISVAGGSFQKLATGVVPPPATSISCTTASLSTGTSGNFTASGCTLK